MSERKISINLGPGWGFCSLLTILFIGLKLGHVIAWSWFWVLSPLWIGLALTLGILVLFFLIFFIAAVFRR